LADQSPSDAFGPGSEETQSIGFRPIHSGGLAEQAAEQLYDAIVEGRLGLGQRLSEAALAREMGISRGPIREAQRLLERRGLLTFYPRRGFFVRTLSAQHIDDLFRLRRVLEGFAVSEAIRRASDGDLRRLIEWRDHLMMLEPDPAVAASSGTPSLLVEEDLALHRIICTISHNESLAQIFEVTLAEIRLSLSLINLGFRSPRRIVESHERLIDAIFSRDEAKACRLMDDHLERSRKLLVEKLEERGSQTRLDDAGPPSSGQDGPIGGHSVGPPAKTFR